MLMRPAARRPVHTPAHLRQPGQLWFLPIEDSVSTLDVTKANPVPGTTRGDPMTALGNTKESVSADVPERPADLPNKTGAPMNFVETDWANWGTVLRIEVTAQSPDANCGAAATSAWLLI